jgi:Protein of unknown function (DUF1488)
VNLWHDMKTRWDKALVSQPRREGNRLIFTIKTEGKRIPCAIARSTLQKVSGHTPLAKRDLLRRFMDSRERIEVIAARILHITPEWVSGPVRISVDDIDNPPPPVRTFARGSFHSPSEVRSWQVRDHCRHPDLIR